MNSEKVEEVWVKIGKKVLNNIKIHLLKYYVPDIFAFYNPKIVSVVRRYARYLPAHVAQSETDDLTTLAKLEFLETLKVWSPDRSQDIWPLAQARIIGAMKDHIRYITKSDPTRFYDWIADAGHMYLMVNDRADFECGVDNGIQLNEAMKVLTYRERRIVLFHAREDLTFKDIGERVGVSESQISRIYKKSIEKLKKALQPL